MKLILVSLLTFLSTTQSISQTLLCTQESVTVYYLSNKSKENKDTDTWKIYVDVENRDTIDLYYSRPYKNSPPELELVSPFLEVTVTNAIPDAISGPLYIHGSVTLHINSDTLSVYKVKTKRFDKSMTVTMRKGEIPEVTGKFIATLMPLNRIKKLKVK